MQLQNGQNVLGYHIVVITDILLLYRDQTSILFPNCYPGSGDNGAYPSVLGQKQGNTMDGWRVHYRANTQIQLHLQAMFSSYISPILHA